jgi:NADH-quinone oxidoreductase subunit M
MVLGAVYMLWMYQRVFLGKLNSPANDGLTDIGLREKLILLPIIVMMFWIGVYSGPFLRRMDASIELIQQRLESARSPEGGYHVQSLQAPRTAGERAK